MHLSGLNISSPSRPKKPVIDKISPNPSDIKVARGFLNSLGPGFDYRVLDSSLGLQLGKVADWLQVKSCILCRRN